MASATRPMLAAMAMFILSRTTTILLFPSCFLFLGWVLCRQSHNSKKGGQGEKESEGSCQTDISRASPAAREEEVKEGQTGGTAQDETACIGFWLSDPLASCSDSVFNTDFRPDFQSDFWAVMRFSSDKDCGDEAIDWPVVAWGAAR